MAIELTFRDWDRYEPDGWSRQGEAITETRQLDAVRAAFAAHKVLVVKHWHYRGSRAPDLVVAEDFDTFLDYLSEHAVAGDAIDVFDVTRSLVESQRIASGKCPDQNEEIPGRGAY